MIGESVVAPQALIQRARLRYPLLPGEELAGLAQTASRTAARRRFHSTPDRVITAHVILATLASEHLARLGGAQMLRAAPAVPAGEPAELALAEHVHVRLEREELLAVALVRTPAVRPRHAADSLNLTLAELRRLEHLARSEAEALTLRYHHELICEPAVLSGADLPAAATAAVRQHFSECRACRRDFERRVEFVLSRASALAVPLPPLAAPARARRWWRPRLKGAPLAA